MVDRGRVGCDHAPECNVVEVSEMVLASNSHYPQSFIQGFESREDIYTARKFVVYSI